MNNAVILKKMFTQAILQMHWIAITKQTRSIGVAVIFWFHKNSNVAKLTFSNQ
jgi:hypothetical protein